MLFTIAGLALPASAQTALLSEFAPLLQAGQIALEFAEINSKDNAETAKVLARADAVFCDKLDHELRVCAERLQWVQFTHSDVAGRVYPELWAGGVQISKARGLVSEDVAAQVWNHLERFAQGLPLANGRVAKPLDLERATVGIVGAGDVGQAIGRVCQQNRLATVGIRRHPDRETTGVGSVSGHIQYHDLVLASQVVVLSLPLTRHTPQTFGEDEIEILPPGTYLINVGRMGLLDTRWVERALTKGWLAGAMLTEWPDDLIAPDSPFRTLPNCLITPAMGYNVPDYWQRFARFARQQTEQFLRTATVSDRVDPHLNY